MTNDDKKSCPRFLQNLKKGKPQLFLFYGTSLTEGGSWSRHLVSHLQEKFPDLISSINTAKGGETSIWGLAHFEDLVIAHKPDVLFMEFTINDAVERFHISLDESRQNLETMLDRMKEALPHCEIILQVMNPVLDRPAGHSGHRGKLPDYCEQWRQLAARRGLRLVDHWPDWTSLLQKNEALFRSYVPDGLHPNDEGYQSVVMPVLRSCLCLED